MTTAANAALPDIPIIDVRDGGAVRLALDGRVRARALRDDCLRSLPAPARMLLPVLDGATRRWLRRSRSPYLADIETLARELGFPGIWFLNGSYQWGCTTLACEQGGAPWLMRTLDWPFPGLGRNLVVARMHGTAGDFDSVTWAGFVGCLTASAPGRFAAAINQAPLWRRTRRPWLRPLDMALNAMRTWRIRFIPPDHLLRDVFENCRDFGEARRRLETTPIARPTIYSLVGCNSSERCIIERTEEGFSTRSDDTAAANDWLRSTPPWEARTRADLLLTRTYEETRENSRVRREWLAKWPGQFAGGGFDWVTPPVLNPYTRLAAAMCPGAGILRVAGYENVEGSDLPQRVTATRELAA